MLDREIAPLLVTTTEKYLGSCCDLTTTQRTVDESPSVPRHGHRKKGTGGGGWTDGRVDVTRQAGLVVPFFDPPPETYLPPPSWAYSLVCMRWRRIQYNRDIQVARGRQTRERETTTRSRCHVTMVRCSRSNPPPPSLPHNHDLYYKKYCREKKVVLGDNDRH